MKQANRVLRQATLITMNTLVTAYGDKIGSDAYEVILVELSSLIRFVCFSNEFPLIFFFLFFTFYLGTFVDIFIKR